MRKELLLLLLPFMLNAESLKSLLEFADKENNFIVAKDLQAQSKKSEVDSSENDLYPTVDIGAYYERDDKPNVILPGTTYSGYAKLSYDIYVGGRKENTLKQKRGVFESSQFDKEATKNSIKLAIVQDFYNLKSKEATLSAREEASKAVEAQLTRMEEFLKASLATQDDVDRLQSAYDSNIYLIESLKFELLSLKKSLELKVGKQIESLNDSTFMKSDTLDTEELNSIRALRATKGSVIVGAEIIDSYYYPQIRIEDTYSLYGYMDKPTFGNTPIKQITNQNQLLVMLNMRLYDFGALSESKRSVLLQADALNEEIKYKTKEQRLQQELALQRIATAKLKIKSAKSALKSATSALITITKKYNSGIVDNVVYLDALSARTESQATFNTACNNLELSYALYYYYNGKNLEEYLHE